jgi:diguanylate cyclase (GGDEF)-like protein
MTQSEPQHPIPIAAPMDAEQISSSMRRIARRQWSLWSSAVMVTVLLALGIASFAFPGLLSQAEESASLLLTSAIRGLVGLVLIFNVYTVYQQLQIHRIHQQLSKQVEALGKMEERTEEVYKLAVLDPLTGLYNRRSGEQRLAQEMSRSTRNGHTLTILALDLDDLKQVNDRFGHPAGDELIRTFAERLSKATRGSDLAARLGGDEFLVLLPECKPEGVLQVLSRLSGLQVQCKGHLVEVSFSAGWTNFKPGESADELLRRADDALYANKRAASKRSLQIVGSSTA